MTEYTAFFSQDVERDIKKNFIFLKAVCCPPSSVLKPNICLYTDFKDGLSWGTSGYVLNRNELSDIWEDRSTLHASDVDYISVNGQKWFYNMNDKIGQFFLQDGSKKVEVEFPYWMEMGQVMKTPGVRSAVFNMLGQNTDDAVQFQKAGIDCFSDELCQEIYRRNPPQEAIETAILGLIEIIRRQNFLYLKQNHVIDIANSAVFKEYQKKRPNISKVPLPEQVASFLRGHKEQIFRFAEKVGIMKNSSKLAKYSIARDHVRHSEIQQIPLRPHHVYRDFSEALGIKNDGQEVAESLNRISDGIDLSLHLSGLGFVWYLLEQSVDPELKDKKGKEAYYNDLVKKGVLTESDVTDIQDVLPFYNMVGHVENRGGKTVDDARGEVMKDRRVFDLAFKIIMRRRQEKQ